MAKDILNEMDETAYKLLHTISSFPQENYNTIPFEDSWTAGQVSEHILKSVSGVVEMLYAPAKPTVRQPNEKAEAIKAMFLNFSIKMKSPEFVLPGNSPIEKNKISTALKDTMANIIEAITTQNISETCTVFELPGFGEFTRAEWIYFAMYHTQRHTHQLKNIYETIAEESLMV
ncbi:MAG: DinB family protein [Chitinophagaceae bacterium]